MEPYQDIQPAKLICVRCGQANNDRASRCAKCQSPLDDFASSSPWEMGTVRSSAYSRVSSPMTKPIIFLGAWLYFGPSAIGALWFIGTFVYGLFEDPLSNTPDSAELTGGVILVAIAMTLYGAASVWVLWSVSKGYLYRPKKVVEQGASLDG